MDLGSSADRQNVSLKVGIDLVASESVSRALADHPDRYLRRVYTSDEVADCRRATAIDPQRLAARFAAKEAVRKVLEPAPDDGLGWRSIAVRRAPSGAPYVQLHGAAAELAERRGIGHIAISLTHEDGCAAAVALAETEGKP